MSNAPEEKQWYALRTMPQHEKKLAAYFQKKGLEHYLPLIPRQRKWSDRVKTVEFPLFPGYIFVRIVRAGDHIQALQHNGSLDFVRVENRPRAIPPADMENLRRLVEHARDLHADPDANFPVGQEIEVRYGPLKGVRGIVQRVKNGQRIYIHVPLLNQMVSAEVDIMDLEKVL